MLTLRLRTSATSTASPLTLFSSPRSDHLKVGMNKEKSRQKNNTKHKQRALQAQRSLEEKKRLPLPPRSMAVVVLLLPHQFSSFPTRVELFVFFDTFLLVFGFVALLQESDVRRSSDGSRVHAFRRGCRNVSPLVRSHTNEKIAVCDGSSFLPRPLVRGTLLSGRFKTRTSRWWFELASFWVLPPLVVLQINSYYWRLFGSLRAGATVLYGINRRNSHLCRLASSLFYVLLDRGKFLIREFPFESVNNFY